MAQGELTALESAFRRIAQDLAELRFGFALVGGLAVSVRAEPRLTRDIDFVLSVDSDADAESVVHGLVELGYTPSQVLEQDATGQLATVRLSTHDGSGVVIDLLFASCGIEHEIVAHAEKLEVLPDLSLPVATTGHLIAMKVLARDDRRRPTDADDLRALVEIAVDADWAMAEQGVEYIANRGYDRGRDLGAALSELRLTLGS